MMPVIRKGLACICIWLACTSIVLDAKKPSKSVSELSSQNNSATRPQGSFEGISRLLGLGNSSAHQDQHRFVGIHLGSGHIFQQYGSNEKASTTEGQGNDLAAIVDVIQVESSKCVDRLEKLTHGGIGTAQELRYSLDQMSARIESIDRSLADIAELTTEILERSEQTSSGCNSTTSWQNDTEISLCPFSANSSLVNSSEWFPSDCREVYLFGCNASGMYDIKPFMSSVPFSVYCEMDAYGGAWTVLQNRVDGSLSFFQKWQKYKEGFGSLDSEFWLGLESIYRMTNSKPYELLVELEDFDGETRYTVYDNFVVSSEDYQYAMRELGNYTGTAGDSLSRHVGLNFSTWDRDNDRSSGENCAMSHGGGWWMGSCGSSTLNGHYLGGPFTQGYLRAGIEWDTWRGDAYSYKRSRMMIRSLYG